jgi:hypothetical protein
MSQGEGPRPCYFMQTPVEITISRSPRETIGLEEAVRVSVNAGRHQNHATKAWLGHLLLLSRVCGGYNTYSPMLHRTADWWGLGLDDDLHDADDAFWCHIPGRGGRRMSEA